jgi:nucleoid DNA-binding protein
MTKAQLIQGISRNLKVTYLEAEKYFNATIDTITSTLVTGEDVVIRGFGRFHVLKSDGRMARNPKTGDPHRVPPHRSPKFKAGKILKALCNG